MHALTQSPSVGSAAWFFRSPRAGIHVLGRLPGAGGRPRGRGRSCCNVGEEAKAKGSGVPRPAPPGAWAVSVCTLSAHSVHTDPGVEPCTLLPTVRRVSPAEPEPRRQKRGGHRGVCRGVTPRPQFPPTRLEVLLITWKRPLCCGIWQELCELCSGRDGPGASQHLRDDVYSALHSPRWLATPQDLDRRDWSPHMER